METRQFPSVQILQLMEQQCLARKQHQAVKDLRDRGGFGYKNFVLQWWTDHLNFKNSLKLKNKVIDNFVTLWLSFVKDIHGEIYWQSRKLQE